MEKIRLMLLLMLIVSTQSIYAQKVDIDVNKSKIEWYASKKVGGSHTGEILLKSGHLELKDGKYVKGHFIVDMNTITNNDLKKKTLNDKLVNHLKSDDFFGIEKFPTAKLNIINISDFTNNKAIALGDLTIKGRTERISFEITKNNNTYSTKLEIDRSKFDVRYGSDSFFDNLGDKVINDIFILNIVINITN